MSDENVVKQPVVEPVHQKEHSWPQNVAESKTIESKASADILAISVVIFVALMLAFAYIFVAKRKHWWPFKGSTNDVVQSSQDKEPLLASASKASKTKLSKSKKKLESVSPEKTAEFHQRAQEFLDHVAKKLPGGQYYKPGSAVADTGQERVISVIERPSQLRLAAASPSATQNAPQHISPAAIPPPPPPLPPPPPRVPSVATPAGVVLRPDVNEELVERIEELYRQVHHQTPGNHSAHSAAV